MEKNQLPKGNVPFVGIVKDHSGNILMNPSIRKHDRRFRSATPHLQMKPQIVQYTTTIGKGAGGRKIKIVVGGKIVWHDPSAFDKSTSKSN